MYSIVGRNVLGCCQRYITNIDGAFTRRFNDKNIDRTDNTLSDDVIEQSCG